MRDLPPEELSPAERLSPQELQHLIASLSDEEAAALVYQWEGWWARPKQIEPTGRWDVWLVLAGRGWGKTRVGAEWVRSCVERKLAKRIALVAPTAADARDVLVEGESGLLAISPPWNRPEYEPSKRRLTWPNGAIATLYSADEPDRLRGPQHDLAWCDEAAAWRYPEAWDQLQLGLRVGVLPRCIVTTTPRPTQLIRELVAAPKTVVTTGTTYENSRNLADSFRQKVLAKYEGTRLGRQELHAEILDDVPGAMFSRAQLDALQVREAPQLRRIVVAVDPSVASGGDGDECGIVVAGVGQCSCKGTPEEHGFVLSDLSDNLSPNEWAQRAVKAYRTHEADRIVAEVNNGGALVEAAVRTVDRNAPYRAVRASQGKRARAEPVAALYEQGRVHHLPGLPKLEDQMVTWDGNGSSPDRMDALVWGLTDLMLDGRMPAEYTPIRVRSRWSR